MSRYYCPYLTEEERCTERARTEQAEGRLTASCSAPGQLSSTILLSYCAIVYLTHLFPSRLQLPEGRDPAVLVTVE